MAYKGNAPLHFLQRLLRLMMIDKLGIEGLSRRLSAAASAVPRAAAESAASAA
ncbi:MAG: hypothetical protein MJ236_00385 [Clostridia bacterium]|nr:hypothetical protein [Clostridia bacterium]